MNKDDMKVVSATLEIPEGGSGFFDLGHYPDGSVPEGGTRRIRMVLEDGSVDYISFYHDEISISPSEVTGKTLSEAFQVKHKKDGDYLRGGL